MSNIPPLSLTPPDRPENIIRDVNMLLEGKINCVGTVTLTNNGTTTTLTDNHINPSCIILLFPQTNHATTVTGLYPDYTTITPSIGNPGGGQVTLKHSAVAQADLTFGYVIFT